MTTQKISINDKFEVNYAVPIWLRDLQIKRNCETVKARVEAVEELRNEPIAVVGYGPTLNDTWEKIKEFKWVITCSGAHPFLIQRGIIPNWHLAVDPLPGNTVRLIGQPHKNVTYLMASTCNPDVMEHLKEYDLRLWHIFDSKEEGLRILPYGEWCLFGGADAGLRCLVMARFLGFTELHVFGIDGSFGASGRHAAEHPSPQKQHLELEYKGRTFYTTPAMMTCVRQLPAEMNQLPDVSATFYGDGLAQAIMSEYKRADKDSAIAHVGVMKKPLFSAEHCRQNEELHKSNLYYGAGGGKHAETVKKLVATMKRDDGLPISVLDYGSGKGLLAKSLPFTISEYDPAIPGKQEAPRPADLVVCTDVLEHVEKENLQYVLRDLQRCVRQIGYFVIHMGPAKKTFPNGENTHLIQESRQWWKAQLRKFFHFPPEAAIEKTPLLYCIVSPKLKPKEMSAVTSTVPQMQCLIEEPEVVNA